MGAVGGNQFETDVFYGSVMPKRIDLLARHHRRLLEIMDAAFPLITATDSHADLRGLRHLRREMNEALQSYARFVGEEVYDRALLATSTGARDDALALWARCLQLQRDYEDFIARWAQQDALANWTKYRLSARRMMQHVRDHILEVAALQKRWTEEPAI